MLWAAAAAFAALAGIAILGDRRRVNRRDADAVGWMPWPLVMVLAIIAAIVAAAAALKS